MDNGDSTNNRLALLEEQVTILAGLMEKVLALAGALNMHVLLSGTEADAAKFKQRAGELESDVQRLTETFETHWRKAGG